MLFYALRTQFVTYRVFYSSKFESAGTHHYLSFVFVLIKYDNGIVEYSSNTESIMPDSLLLRLCIPRIIECCFITLEVRNGNDKPR